MSAKWRHALRSGDTRNYISRQSPVRRSRRSVGSA
jgi:hypothetical protein